MNKRVLVTDPIATEGIEKLKAGADVDVKLGIKPEELIKIIGDYDALVVRSETKVKADIISVGKKLQVIGRAGVGVDNIDVEAATKRGIVVVNAPTGNTISTAEHTMALLLSMARKIPQSCSVLRNGEWKREEFMGTELRGKTLGVIGLGKVGSAVTRRAQGFEMRIMGYDPFISAEYAKNNGIEMVSLETLLKESDFITIHTTMTSKTRGLIGEKELGMVKPSVRFINAARGGIIDEEALYKAVTEGRVAGAAIDVFSKEPAIGNILLKCNNIVVTPHLGASTSEAQTNVAVDVAEQVLTVLNGQPAKYAVNAPIIPAETFTALAPYLKVAECVGEVGSQLAEGQLDIVNIKYEGDIANYDTTAVKATIIKAILEPQADEPVNIINAGIVAQSRGIRVVEQKDTRCENYTNLITVELVTSTGKTMVGGTLMRGETHIVLVNSFWIDLVATGGYWVFSDHLDRPGLIGRMGAILGDADINISSMQLVRLEPRGKALMVLRVDEFIPEDRRQLLLKIPDVYTVKLVKF
ncbi:MAG: phosphoglycerate dehydrogenase [Chloroflexi bacterium]|nr:phosphoglycerate dehydrogenase [Chloroflexota bacterium]